MTTEGTLQILILLFPISELLLGFIQRSRRRTAQSHDRGSFHLLWLSILLGIGLALAARRIPATRLPLSAATVRLVALAFLICGLTIRWTAILTLRRLFTVDVAIHSHHPVVQSGLYRFMRHPSYTGLLLAFLGIGVYFANWISLLGLLVPVTLAVLRRVAIEERALLDALGSDYASYCDRTRRFLPGLF